MTPLADHAGLELGERQRLKAAVARLATLEEVIRWGLGLPRPSVIADVVVQDEYSHDVVMPWGDDHHIVFDTT